MSNTQLMTMPQTSSAPKVITTRMEFAMWLYKETMGKDKIPTGRIISAEKAAKKVQQLRQDGQPVLQHELGGYIQFARLYFEKEFQCTLWNIRGMGWRASNKIETAKYYGKSVRKTIAWADRTRQLSTIVERKYIPYAIKEVVGNAEGGIKTLSGMRKRFTELWGEYQLAEQKQIEGIKANGNS